MKSLPVIQGDTVYINGFSTPENDPGKQIKLPSFPEVLAESDKNADKQRARADGVYYGISDKGRRNHPLSRAQIKKNKNSDRRVAQW